MRPVTVILDAVQQMQDAKLAMLDQGGDDNANHALALEYVVEALLWAIDAEPPTVSTSISKFLGQSCEEPDHTIPEPGNN